MKRVSLAVLVLAICAVLSLFWKVSSNGPFFYDEADYMYAGTRGFVNNYLDRPSISTIEFIRQGLSLARNKSQNSQKSKEIRAAGDITFYRHYHGPVYACWISFCQAIGFHEAGDYRASGLILHGLTVLIIFLSFRVAFPEYSAVAGLLGALTFLLNRTGIMAATIITQHVMFGLVASITLLFLALFSRTRRPKFWYLTAAAVGVAFSTVETSFVLVGAVALVFFLATRERTWKDKGRLFGLGVLAFLGAILAVWPMGVLALGGLKGYLYLAYMTIVRKVFTPIGPVELWKIKVAQNPEEYIIPAVALLLLTVFWKRLAARDAAMPYLAFTWFFWAVTLVITLPNTYYLDALLMSASVVVGIAMGELWKRGSMPGAVASAVLVASLVYMGGRYYREMDALHSTRDPRFDLLAYLKSDNRGQTLYAPFELVPTVHFYLPEITAAGYDQTWTVERLADAINATPSAELLCEEKLCAQVGPLAHLAPGGSAAVMASDKELSTEPLYSFVPAR